MHIWKDREGKAVSGKEFLTRWKQGINSISPYTLAKNERFGQFIMFVGLIIGLAVSVYGKQWWLCIILVGGLISILVSLIGTQQKINSLAIIYGKEEDNDEPERTVRRD